MTITARELGERSQNAILSIDTDRPKFALYSSKNNGTSSIGSCGKAMEHTSARYGENAKPITNFRMWVSFYNKLPLNTTSRLWGRIADVKLPPWLRTPVHKTYGWLFNVQMDEIEHCQDLKQYTSLAQFFRRNLQADARPVDTTACIISPADGTVLNCGEVHAGHLEQVKGVVYTLNGLLGPNTWSTKPNWADLGLQFPKEERRKFIEVLLPDSLSVSEVMDSENEAFSLPKQWSASSIDTLLCSTESMPDLCDVESLDVNKNFQEKNADKTNLLGSHKEQGSMPNLGLQNTFNQSPKYWPNPAILHQEINYESKLKLRDSSSETTLYHCVIYLGPGDYHKFHSPTKWKIFMRRHFPGRLFSVSPKVANWFTGLFCANERASYVGRWQHGFFAFVAVGAFNVGSIRVYQDENLITNRSAKSRRAAILKNQKT
ncbi:phosphatidylserine decarboxylase 1, partial [Cichlidogyrus casuarinus]